jgi:hypothetical protein
MDNILIIHPGPLGQHSGTLFYCKFLKNSYNVNYVGIDEGFGFTTFDNIESIHLRPIKNSFLRKFKYFNLAIKILKKKKYRFILINYFPFCSLFLIFNKSAVVEVRTSYIFKSKIKRSLYNFILKNEVKLFNNITTLTQSLSDFLNLPKRTKIIPLGGPSVEIRKRNFENLSFLYVGTFRQRNIHKTIIAFRNFLNLDYRNLEIKIDFHIVGFGSNEDVNLIKHYIEILNLSNYVIFHGEVRYPQLNNIFKNCNVGLAYVPKYDYFMTQPVTKTCEYLLNGMPVIATSLKEHQLLINSENGVVIEDDITDITYGFKFIFENRHNYSSDKIQLQSVSLSWEYIIDQILIPYIESI